jgi:hypothetical protein
VDVVIGIDVGQKIDPTAIAVVELEWRDPRERPGFDDHHIVRHLERLPLGTPYPKAAERLAEVVAGVRARGYTERVAVSHVGGYQPTTTYQERTVTPSVSIFVDATGVGQPVVDLLEVAGVRPLACYFTHGDRRTKEGRRVSIGKAWLVSRLQSLLQTGRLHLPATDEARVLAKELLDYEIRVDQDANDRYGAFRVGTHDDLVTALGLGVQPALPRWGTV